jgi:hypothetical protein
MIFLAFKVSGILVNWIRKESKEVSCPYLRDYVRVAIPFRIGAEVADTAGRCQILLTPLPTTTQIHNKVYNLDLILSFGFTDLLFIFHRFYIS